MSGTPGAVISALLNSSWTTGGLNRPIRAMGDSSTAEEVDGKSFSVFLLVEHRNIASEGTRKCIIELIGYLTLIKVTIH